MKNKTQCKQLLLLLLVFTFSAAIAFGQNCGDINADGSADIIDALLVAQCYVGLTSCPSADIGDVNCDGQIDIVDALLIAQLYVGLLDELACCGTPEPTPRSDTYELQAEDEQWSSGGVESDHSGYTGTGYVNTDNASGEWIEWSVEVDNDCNATCVFSYACASDARPMDLSINGTDAASLGFPASGAWDSWATETADVILDAGSNAIRLTATGSGGAPNMDKMDITIKGGAVVTPTPTPAPTPTPTPTPTPEPTEPGATPSPTPEHQKPRVIATTDGEVDDECSLVRFLLYANEWDVQGIITSSSQYHWQGHDWAGDDWQEDYLDAYEQVYPNLVQHDPEYPTPAYIRAQSHLGNVKDEGDMDEPTAGSQHIVQALLDASDDRPIWLQAWGGVNTIARALKTIQDDYPARMEEVAAKVRLFLIWEQDSTFQDYIRPNWSIPYNILTIVSDQFITFGYWWEDWDFPDDMAHYFSASWMNENLLENHGPLLAIYRAQSSGEFRSEGDSPSFLHAIPNGLRSTESPDWGGWGGRYILVRENTWLDPVPEEGYTYPSGRWYTSTAWGRESIRDDSATQEEYLEYFKQIYRWVDVMQHDFAARADWCVTPNYGDANHEPNAQVAGGLERTVSPGSTATLDASPSTDPDGDQLSFSWWQYYEADSANTEVTISNASSMTGASFTVPNESGKNVHIILEVTDNGTPALTRYQRIVFNIN